MGTIVHVAMLVYNQEQQATTSNTKQQQATTSNTKQHQPHQPTQSKKQHQPTTTTTSTTTITTTTTTTSSIVNGGFTRCGHSFVVVARPFIFVRVVWPCKIPFAEKENNERKKERALIRQCGGVVVWWCGDDGRSK
jgi:outer membrane biosynthesis protein TonB